MPCSKTRAIFLGFDRIFPANFLMNVSPRIQGFVRALEEFYAAQPELLKNVELRRRNELARFGRVC